MKIYTDRDASLKPLEKRTIAILGYGNQGRAQALNLRDQGLRVIIGNREDNYREQARKDGFETFTLLDAATAADFLFILTTDESQPLVWEEQIAPGLTAGNTLVWASGYNVGYELITPPSDADVVMVAPRMTGNMVRILFERGKGAIAQVAVHQDASGEAWARMMAIAKGIGSTRGGVFESTFREESELDLFAEQIVWSGEASEILGLMAKNGFYKQMSFHSTTSQYGTLSRAPRLLNQEIRNKMRELVERDIKGGAFAREWKQEQAGGSQTLAKLKQEALRKPMNEVEAPVIALLQQGRSFSTE